MTCPLCRERKGKRRCPAKDTSICSACCGSKRIVEIACPAGCVYLSGAHAGAWDGRTTERARDQRLIGPHVQQLSEAQLELLLAAVLGVVRLREERRELQDRLLLDAVQALRKTLETRSHGILYEHDTADLRAHGLLHALRALFEGGAGGRPPDDRDLLPVLQALEGMIQAAAREGGATEFLELAGRVAAEARRESQPAASRLILEP